MSTFSAKPADVKHEWFVIDATDKVLGRIASEAAFTRLTSIPAISSSL
jgi:large subunit ribosomal protein L13